MDTLLIISLVAIFSLSLHVTDARRCLTSLHLYGETGSKDKASTTGGYMFAASCKNDHFFRRYYNPMRKYKSSERYEKEKGQVWSALGLDTNFCCPSIDALSSVDVYQEYDKVPNRWYVKHMFVYAEIEDSDLALVGVKFNANAWIGRKKFDSGPMKTLELTKDMIEYDNCIAKDQCITTLYVMADTADGNNADSDTGHSFTINDKTVKLYNLPGDDMKKRRADLWEFTESKLGDECIKFSEVTYAGFKACGKDGWKIETAIVTVQLESGDYALLAGDVNLNKWVDKDKKHPDRAKVPLTLRNEPKDCANN